MNEVTGVSTGTLSNSSKPRFTKEQVEYLGRLYPERVGFSTATHAEVMFYMGQRSVVLQLTRELGGA